MPKQHVTTLCAMPACEFCPKIYIDNEKPAAKQIEVNDDFGGKVFMSKEQLASFVDQAKEGKLDFNIL
jgi:hypothetical protein